MTDQQEFVDMMKEAESGRQLAAALDQFFNDLRYTAPEAVGQRLNELGARVTYDMGTFGFPKDVAASDNIHETGEGR